MSLFGAFNAAASGMGAERTRMDVIADNLANANTTRGPDGRPFQRGEVVLQSAGSSFSDLLGVRVAGVAADETPGKRVYDPGHPDADVQGYVTMPNVTPVTEMVDLITATRSYEANVQVMTTARQMFQKALEVLR